MAPAKPSAAFGTPDVVPMYSPVAPSKFIASPITLPPAVRWTVTTLLASPGISTRMNAIRSSPQAAAAWRASGSSGTSDAAVPDRTTTCCPNACSGRRAMRSVSNP